MKAQVGVDAGILAVGVHGKGSVTAVFAVVVNHPKCDGEVCLETGISGSAAFGITATVGYGYFSYTWEKDVYKLTTDKLMAYPVLYAGDGS